MAMGAPGLLDMSVLLVWAWAWQATCHVLLSVVVVCWSWGNATRPPTRKTHLS